MMLSRVLCKSNWFANRTRGRLCSVRRASNAAKSAAAASNATFVSPSAVAAVVGALLRHRRLDTARSITQQLGHSDRYVLSPGSELLTATAAVEAESGERGSTRTTNKLFHQVLQSPASLTDDVIRQIIRVDLNNGQVEAALAKLESVLDSLAALPQPGAITSGAFTPLAIFVIRNHGFAAFEEMNQKLLAAQIPITLRYITSAMETFYILGNASNVNAVWEKYIDEQLHDMGEQSQRIAPNSFCVRQRLWALRKTARVRDMEIFFDKWYRSGLFYADLDVYMIMLHSSRDQKNLSRLTSTLAEMKAKKIQLDQRVYNLAVSAFIDGGDSERAKHWLDEMSREGFLPNQATFESLLLMASTRGASVEDLVDAVKRAFSSGSFVPKGPSWRSALSALLQRAHPDDVAPIVSESLRLNPNADIDVLDALLSVNLERYFSSSPEERQSVVETIDQLWDESRSRTHLLSDVTISNLLKYEDTSKGSAHAFQLAQTLAAQLPTFRSSRQTLSVIVRLFAQNDQFDSAINLLRTAARREVRPLQPDAFISIIRALSVDTTRVESLVLEYLSLFGWRNSMTVHVCRVAVETVSKTQLVNSVRPQSLSEVESQIIPSEIPSDSIKPLEDLVGLLDKEISTLSSRDSELTFILVEAHTLLALARLRHDKDGPQGPLKRALYWLQEASRVGGVETRVGLAYRLSFAMIQTGGIFLLEGEKLLRRTQRDFKTATPRFLLQLLLRSKLAKIKAEFSSSGQYPAKTPLLANLSAELDEATSVLRQLLDHWKDASLLTSVMHHLCLDGLHGRYKALGIFYETLRKYHLPPLPAAFRLALSLVSFIRDTADEYANGRVDEERRGSLLKREEALRLYDLYKRYRPIIRLSNGPDQEELDESPKQEVLFDTQVTKDLIRVMAEAGFLIEAERLANDLAKLSELEGGIGAVPLILAYARGGRLGDSARVFQRVLDLPGVPHVILLEALRLMLHACADTDRIDVAWQIWNTVYELPDSPTSPKLGINELGTMAFALARRSEWSAILKLFDQHRAKAGAVESAVCLRFIRALKHLPGVTLEERGQLTQWVEARSTILAHGELEHFRATLESWIRRAAPNEVAAFVKEL